MRFAYPHAVAFAIAAGLASLSACNESSSPNPPEDGWAEAVLAGVRIQQTVTDFEEGTAIIRLRETVRDPSLSFAASRDRASVSRSRKGTVVRHFQGKNGTTHSLGVHYESDNAPPRHIFAFENGKLRFIASSRYAERGGGFERTGLRITLLDEQGRVERQVDLTSSSTTASASRVRDGFASVGKAAADAVALLAPRALHAEEVPSACLQEWLNYLSATMALATANAVLKAVIVGCVPVGGACLTIPQAFTAWTAALAAWNLALDKLAACIEINKKPDDGEMTDGPNPGGGGGGGGVPDENDYSDDLAKTVDDFINAAVANGNYYCDPSGNSCTYYAMS